MISYPAAYVTAAGMIGVKKMIMYILGVMTGLAIMMIVNGINEVRDYNKMMDTVLDYINEQEKNK